MLIKKMNCAMFSGFLLFGLNMMGYADEDGVVDEPSYEDHDTSIDVQEQIESSSETIDESTTAEDHDETYQHEESVVGDRKQETTTPQESNKPKEIAKAKKINPGKSVKDHSAKKPAWKKHSPANRKKLSMNKTTILKAQEALNKQGIKVGKDGQWGPKTRQAVREFQKKNKLKVTGELDQETLNKLGVR